MVLERTTTWSRVPTGPETKNDCAGEGKEQIASLHCPALLRAALLLSFRILFLAECLAWLLHIVIKLEQYSFRENAKET
jgi:hypothetical protein